MVDVFISKRLNKLGLRYDFVKFREVEKPRVLEGRVDKICIGNMKLIANLAKYKKTGEGCVKDSKYFSRGQRTKVVLSEVYQRKRRKGVSYAQAV